MIPSWIPQIPGLSPEQVFSLMNCRTLKQFITMYRAYLAGEGGGTGGNCPFCDPLGPKNVVVRENRCWRLWANPFPLEHTSHHLILGYQRHTFPNGRMTVEDFTAAGELFLWARDEYDIAGGCFAWRFGPLWDNAGSVLHPHINIIRPDGTGSVQVTVAKDLDKIAEITLRLEAFTKLMNGIQLEELSAGEQKVVEGRLG